MYLIQSPIGDDRPARRTDGSVFILENAGDAANFLRENLLSYFPETWLHDNGDIRIDDSKGRIPLVRFWIYDDGARVPRHAGNRINERNRTAK